MTTSIEKVAIGNIPAGIDRGLQVFLMSIKTYLETTQASELPVYTAEQLNSTTAKINTGKLVRCSNGDTGSECLAYCDGFNWKVVQLGNTVSSS